MSHKAQPHFFSPEDLRQGQLLVDKKCIGDVLFSGGTYQVEVKVEGKVFWPFLQISDAARLKDHFCSCPEAEERNFCPHQAGAWLKIFNNQSKPLHMRFQDSFWARLCWVAFRRHGDDLSLLQGSVGAGYTAFSTTRKKLFSVEGRTPKGKKVIRSIIAQRKPETEESSLKFSNLSAEELVLWKEGRPTPKLSFELSFWSDLAKWCFAIQENLRPHKIEFLNLSQSDEDLPQEVVIEFADLSLYFYISEAHWPELIPTLVTVDAPLKVYEPAHEQIQKIFYDPSQKVFQLEMRPHEEPKTASYKKQIGEWGYVAGKGFYPLQIDPLLKQPLIPTSQIKEFLEKHRFLLKRFLEKYSIHEEILAAKYDLTFDEKYHLRITYFLFEKGDLQKMDAAKFGSWVFLPERGFFFLEEPLFDEIETVIPPHEVSHFVSRHRHWLHAYEGFQTHVTSVESHLGYTLSPGGIEFTPQIDLADNLGEIIDFQEWIYVRGHGFYAKHRVRERGVLKAGLKVPREGVNAFIQRHRDELESVAHFFTSNSPLKSSGVKVELSREAQILISPFYTFQAEYNPEQVEIFEDYSFVKGEGFCEIPSKLKLPSPYFRPLFIDKAAEPYFVAYELDVLKPYILEIDPRLQKPDRLELQVQSLERKEDGSWLVALTYKTPLALLGTIDVWKALNVGKKHLFSPAGLILLNSPRFNWLRGISKKQWLKKGEKLSLTTVEWIRLFAFEQMTPPTDEKSRTLWKQFHEMQPLSVPNLERLQSQLRPYQNVGINWLWFLYSYALSGLLCDEMGLGKTHQAMALLAAASHASPQAKFLVVCPTSVIFHWQDLLARFLPTLRVCVYYGTHRNLRDFAQQYDLILTSYGTLRSEKEILSDISFAVAIFDEIQIAKNHLSQTHKALKALKATTRIGLTGTPIENNLLEFKALFDVVLPGYMPTETVYKELFVHPIEKQDDQERATVLRKLTLPFVLRRRKSEVLLELPEKVETIAYAPLSEEQKKLYQEVYSSSREKIFQELNDSSKPTPYLHIFALLTKLKQICNHPALYLDCPSNFHEHSSGKWDLFVELLQETRASGQKLVVFSQYLGMLDIIEHYLTAEKIGFATIRGSTRDRGGQVTRFRDDPQCEVFVGSLQAAGVGIDLVAASVVILYDRWWNPAKEKQAIDRTHRIGQTRGVQVFKMVVRGTLEEHIHRLVEEKLSLFEKVIGYDNQNELKNLSRNDLIALLHRIEEGIF